MKYFLSYSFLGNDETKLKENLEKISNKLEKDNNKTFIFLRDIKNWGKKQINEETIMDIALKELEKSDCLFALIENENISEGKSMEIGFAKALNKKIILLVKKGINLRLSKYLADKIIYFENINSWEI